MAQTLIKTTSSSLTLRRISPTETDPAGMSIFTIIAGIVASVKDKLHVRPPIKVFNRECRQARDVGFYSDESEGYHYSRQMMPSEPLSENMRKLLQFINTTYNSNFNAILINRYNNGCDKIGAHSDDESFLDKSGVVTLSWGATRKFRIRDKKTKKIHTDIPLKDLSVVHMAGDFQKEFTHEIPVEKKVRETRISFTFRHHLK